MQSPLLQNMQDICSGSYQNGRSVLFWRTTQNSLAKLQVIHARSGVPYEIMGLMQGKVMGDALVIIDSFALPVQGTETRVNAANEANEYMVQYLTESEKARKVESIELLLC
jgi:JAB1/Mov34/MPN/PAD-1 ubiquitin protease